MLARERQIRILSIIRANHSIRISDIIREFHVSHETARRDLDVLQESNLVTRVHGGAVLSEQAATPASPSQEQHSVSGMAWRIALGKTAAAMIKSGETVFLSVGLTIQQIAKALRARSDLTVLTNSVLVLNELINSDVRLYVLGGLVNHSENNIEGELARQTLLNFRVDTAFIGAGGISKEIGVSDYSPEVASLNKQIIDRAKKSVLVAGSNKFGRECLGVTCPLSGIDTVITDSELSEKNRKQLEENGVNLVLAKTK